VYSWVLANCIRFKNLHGLCISISLPSKHQSQMFVTGKGQGYLSIHYISSLPHCDIVVDESALGLKGDWRRSVSHVHVIWSLELGSESLDRLASRFYIEMEGLTVRVYCNGVRCAISGIRCLIIPFHEGTSEQAPVISLLSTVAPAMDSNIPQSVYRLPDGESRLSRAL